MRFEPIHIILSIFILFAFSRVLLRFNDKTISYKEAVFWSLLWIGAAIVIFMPGFTGTLATILGIGRGADLIIYIAIILNFYIVFRLYVKLDKLDNNITTIVEKIAHKDASK